MPSAAGQSLDSNYDPSHLGYQGVDYTGFIHRFADRIFIMST